MKKKTAKKQMIMVIDLEFEKQVEELKEYLGIKTTSSLIRQLVKEKINKKNGFIF